MQTHSALTKAFDKTCLLEAQLMHNIVTSLSTTEITDHDIFFLNNHAKDYLESADEKYHNNYNTHKKSIRLLFELVPEHFKEKLEWNGPDAL
ncbi:hypothetical protein [Xenorhabdus szentirmaii]|nr:MULTISPECIES: hypothetical protein [unclassified Xenorhabdus]